MPWFGGRARCKNAWLLVLAAAVWYVLKVRNNWFICEGSIILLKVTEEVINLDISTECL